MDWLQQMLGRMFLPISRNDALQIVSATLADHARSPSLICHGAQPDNCHIYNTTSEPCWYIYVPWNDDHNGMAVLRSGRVILVGKLTGMIHYDGSAGDEGQPFNYRCIADRNGTIISAEKAARLLV